MASTNAGVQASREDVWYLKSIQYQGNSKKVITQNFNGPCSFIAICNILILRGDIEILPEDRTSVSYEFLSQLVAEYLLRASPDMDIGAALSMMPMTQRGMDLNPLFTGPTLFKPAGDGGALKLFEQANIELLHGWLVDPDAPEYSVLSKSEDYDHSVNVLVEADSLTKGRFVPAEEEDTGGSSSAGPSSSSAGEQLSPKDQRKVEDAIAIRHFLDTTSSQLTYYGLFTIASHLKPGALVALFRNSHLTVLHKPEGDESALFTLVTDHIFYNEPSVVWERLEDVDGGSSSFVDSDFVRSVPAGGDFAGQTAESTLAALDALNLSDSHASDQELARQLQAEEDARAQRFLARREEARIKQVVVEGRKKQPSQPSEHEPKKKKDCIIM